MFYILASIYIFVSFLVGLFLIWLSIDYLGAINAITYCLDKLIASGMDMEKIFRLVGGLIIVACVAFIVRLAKRTHREKSIILQTSGGSVSISLSAIEDMIKKILEEKGEIARIKPKVKFTRKGIHIFIRGSLKSDVNLMELSSQVRSEVKKRMDNLLGGGQDVKVNLEIRKLAFSPKKEIEEREPEVPFRNY
jgi:UDP-N-acetylmuramyl pentapeptide phosphotransferase/UDP-N-acetylglucosamine-1-phosphate transferase